MKKQGKSFNGRKPGQWKSKNSKEYRDQIPALLPPLMDQLAVGFTLRFVTTANFTGVFTVTSTNLLDAWFVAGTATTAYQLFDFVRVKRVTVRAMGVENTGGQAPPSATVGIEYPGLVVGSSAGGKQVSNSSLGQTTPAFCSLSPDPKSECALFQTANGNILLSVRAVDQAGAALTGAIIDVEVVYRNSADVNPAAISQARAGLTAGDLYFGGLDGLPLASTQARSAFVRRA